MDRSNERQLALDPTNTVYGVNRFIGRRFQDRYMKRILDSVPFSVVDIDGQPYIQVDTHEGGRSVLSVVEILSMILKRAKSTAETYLGGPVHTAVVSINPSEFFGDYRDALLDAAYVVGIDTILTIKGPSAVLTSYVANPSNPRPEWVWKNCSSLEYWGRGSNSHRRKYQRR